MSYVEVVQTSQGSQLLKIPMLVLTLYYQKGLYVYSVHFQDTSYFIPPFLCHLSYTFINYLYFNA